LRADDTILSIGGKPVRTMEEFHALIDSHRPGEQVAVVIERDGRQASVTVTLEAIPPDGGTGRILAAAEAGESWAMMEMGVRYSHGRGNLSYCKKDPEEAVRWFRRSMEAGYTLGPLFLADMYRKGEGVEQDYAEAKRLYEKALLVQGEGLHKGVYIAATNRLAAMYLAGQGTPEDPQKAFQLYHDAALHGSSSAMVKVGKMCEAGQGVQKDMSKAVGWYRHAAGLGYTPAQKELDRLAPRK
jgi:TPR repeat protein